MAKFQIKRDEQIFTQMLARVVARSDLSDVTDTSSIKHMLAAAARSDGEIYYQMFLLLQLFSIDTATGDDLDERAKDIQPAIMSRFLASKAVGNVVFSRNGTSGSITIPVGTKVKTADGVVFSTTSPGYITPTSAPLLSDLVPNPEHHNALEPVLHVVGRDSNQVPVLADVAGSSGRVAANTVVKFGGKPLGVDAVTNISAFTAGGLDTETDDSFRNRLKQFIAGLARSTVQALEAGVIGASDSTTGSTILFSHAVEDLSRLGLVTLYIDDGSGTAMTSSVISNEVVTTGLSGPPANTAVGGETTLYLDKYPVNADVSLTVISDQRGQLIEGTDFLLNPANGQLSLLIPLSASEQIKASYTYYTGVIAVAQKIVDGDPTDRSNYPGLRAGGILVLVKTPQVLLQNVEVTLIVSSGYVQSSVQVAVKQAIKDYINGLQISDDVILNELITRIMEVPGVSNCTVNQPGNDIVILDDQLARTSDQNIVVS